MISFCEAKCSTGNEGDECERVTIKQNVIQETHTANMVSADPSSKIFVVAQNRGVIKKTLSVPFRAQFDTGTSYSFFLEDVRHILPNLLVAIISSKLISSFVCVCSKLSCAHTAIRMWPHPLSQ